MQPGRLTLDSCAGHLIPAAMPIPAVNVLRRIDAPDRPIQADGDPREPPRKLLPAVTARGPAVDHVRRIDADDVLRARA
jgi:hypothetical protein